MELPGIPPKSKNSRSWPLRLSVMGAILLSILVFAPLVWHVHNTFDTFKNFNDAHLDSEIVRDKLAHLNQHIVQGTRELVACGEGDNGHLRVRLVQELDLSLEHARLEPRPCKTQRFMELAGSAQDSLRRIETLALTLSRFGAMAQAQDFLQSPEYWSSLDTFNACLDSMASQCCTARNQTLTRERGREGMALAGAAVLLALSLTTWITLLRRIEIREQSLSAEVQQRRRTESRLMATLQRCEKLFNDAYDSIFLINPETGRILDANQMAAQRLGYTRDELCGKFLGELDVGLAGELVQFGGVAQRLGSCTGKIEERQHRHRDGTLLTMEVSYHLVQDGQMNILQCFSRDMTERNLLEKQLCQAQKMECVGRIASGIAHDFSNLLLAIRGYATVASRLLEKRHPANRPLEQVEQASSQAIDVSRSLLSFANGQGQVTETVELHCILTNVGRLLKPALPPSIILETPSETDEKFWVRADSSQLQQAILNLGLNAREALPRGGRIVFALFRDKDRARVEISDNGEGIPPELLERIWEPFFTTRTGGRGTGLGLFNVKSALEACDGTFSVSSSPDQGTCFTLLIPLASAPASPAAMFLSDLDQHGSSQGVLLAESHGFAREVMLEALRLSGFVVHPAANGTELSEYFHPGKSPAGDQAIDLVILDPDLPGAGGMKCLDEIRRRDANLPIILIGARRGIPQEEGLDQHTVILTKPFEMKELCRLAHSLLSAGVAREGRSDEPRENSSCG
jgi:PAS domain S-box-containing protein